MKWWKTYEEKEWVCLRRMSTFEKILWYDGDDEDDYDDDTGPCVFISHLYIYIYTLAYVLHFNIHVV